ncbi:MAG: ATP-binding protein [Intestinibacter sp.]
MVLNIKNNNDPIIKISVKDEKDKVYLTIWDNGIGIPKNDIKRVFDKSFTGENGRIMAKSTGMGLYIVKKLCDKLGHKIIIESEIHKYTKLQLSFIKMIFIKLIKVYADLDTKNKYYKIVIFCNIRITTNPIFYITM